MAQKLHDTYNFSYDKLKVLLGGWNAWNGASYPTETSAVPAGSSKPGSVTTNTIPLSITSPVVITK